MNAAEIESKVREIIVEQLGVDESQVTREAAFIGDLHCDSLDSVEVLLQIEDAFPGVEITDKQAEELTTVGKLCEWLEEKLL